MKNVEVLPAILVPTLKEIEGHLARVQGIAPYVQLDVCDGVFVPMRTWPMHAGDTEEFTRIVEGHEGLPFQEVFNFEVDLMVHQPEVLLEQWSRLGITRAIFHINATHDLNALKRIAFDNDIELGVAVMPDTDMAQLALYMHHVDYVQVMGIEHIGKQGEPFSEKTISTVRSIREAYPNAIIQIDGGVNAEVAPSLITAGANRLASGSFIFSSNDPAAAITQLTHV
ncbi:MAG: hypothetical protein ACJKTH_03800 [Patescibacteria group bacterium UBA2163]